MRTSKDKRKKKVKNVFNDEVKGKFGKIYIPEQEIREKPMPDKSKGLKRERREAKLKHKEQGSSPKKRRRKSR